jgi:hypothetical protein
MADERSGGTEEVWINPSTHSIARMSSILETSETHDNPPTPEMTEQLSNAWRLASANASLSIRSRLSHFVESVKRRRDRDLMRMSDYYRMADEEIRRKIMRTTAKGERPQTGEIDRLMATARAYEARTSELVQRYKVRVRVEVLATLACTIPTYRIDVHMLRRLAKSEMSFTWNPIDRRVEARCCDACLRTAETASLCDEKVHYVCADCLKKCPSCSKAFCRACHARCPRAHV